MDRGLSAAASHPEQDPGAVSKISFIQWRSNTGRIVITFGADCQTLACLARNASVSMIVLVCAVFAAAKAT
jgi:hypothetical protein